MRLFKKKLNILVLGSDGMLGYDVFNDLNIKTYQNSSIINRVVPKKSAQPSVPSPAQPSVQSYQPATEQPATEQPVAEIPETNVENNETNSAD